MVYVSLNKINCSAVLQAEQGTNKTAAARKSYPMLYRPTPLASSCYSMSSLFIVVTRLCWSRGYVAFELFGLPDDAVCTIYGFLGGKVCGDDSIFLHRSPAGMMALFKVFRSSMQSNPIRHYQSVICQFGH